MLHLFVVLCQFRLDLKMYDFVYVWNMFVFCDLRSELNICVTLDFSLYFIAFSFVGLQGNVAHISLGSPERYLKQSYPRTNLSR